MPPGQPQIRQASRLLADAWQVKPLAHLEIAPEDFPFLKVICGLDDDRLAEYGQTMQTGAPWPE